ncbi:D-alanine--D-alanine ligase [Reinekea marina]|uniref:D-alanine--D-alanine ligase n=1 Tax=Reinekea marina TaxID=1310421 RepID=A0ABV7WTK2_9GAMM|nr:D-alanine--D-alanine ligase [Reinekea marina]MDN3650524.1 D-alanine--D-alanine ligase [Reinekea marina]
MTKVAVIYGGMSSEREVALMSGETVIQGLKEAGYNVVSLDLVITESLVPWLQAEKPDLVFPVLHGGMGEDGTLQAVLQWHGFPFTGSGVIGSAVALDKYRSKQIFRAAGLPTADFNIVKSAEQARQLEGQLHYPVFVKPANEGSSIGISRVNSKSEFLPAIELAMEYDKEVLVETFIDGPEYTVGIVGDELMPVVSMKSQTEFYDYEAKYISDDTEYNIPSGLSDEKEAYVQSIAKQAFEALNCSGWGRVDLMMNSKGEVFILEVNTIPGMTSHSLVPMSARAKGWSLAQLMKRIVDTV